MDPLPQLTTALTGRYEIEREIGAGGMATVYLARDVKHGRPVALKVLKPELGAVLGVDRFLSEIAVTANLQHPNLLPLFDSGEAGGLLFYVMPFVEGESLRARLDREKQLPLDEAVRIAVAIAGALDYAHQHGVIHRDLKPENILLQAGQPVIADFGIALAVSNAGGARVTQTGLSLGTPQYMSPEQATGDRAIDARTDIYSLAAMTYEMLTGEPPHTGSTAQAIIAKLMTEEVRSLSVLRRTVPPHVDAAVRHGLEKLAADRFGTAGDFALALTGARPFVGTGMSTAAMASATGTIASRASRGTRALIAALAVIAVGGVSAAAWLATRPPPVAVLSRFDLKLPEGVQVFPGAGTKLGITRDGSAIVVAGIQSGRTGLYLRRLEDPVAQLVRGTDGQVGAASINPQFSPNGEWIVYGSSTGLKKIPAVGGTPQTLADSNGAASWGPNDVVLYASGDRLLLASAEGRDGREVAAPDTARNIRRLRWPHLLPNGTHALVTITRGANPNVPDSMEIALLSLADGDIVPLELKGTNAHYSATGHIVFARSPGLVFAAPFSLRKLAVTAAPRLVMENIWLGSGGAAGFAVSDNGTIVGHGGASSFARTRELVRVSRDGAVTVIPGGAMAFSTPRVSPDGDRIAVAVDVGPSLDGGMVVIDASTGARQRLTEPGGGQAGVWSPDGRRVVFVRSAASGREVVSRAWDQSSDEIILSADSSRNYYEISVGPRGGYTALRGNFAGNRDIFVAPSDSLSAARPLVATPANERNPAVSPDGRWLAYASNESDRSEIYVQPLPGPGPRVQISIDGGVEPVWSRDGSTLFFRGPTKIQAARLAGPPYRVVQRDSLFEDAFVGGGGADTDWDVYPDGQSFLMMRVVGGETLSEVSVLLNWPLLLSRSAAAGAPRN